MMGGLQDLHRLKWGYSSSSFVPAFVTHTDRDAEKAKFPAPRIDCLPTSTSSNDVHISDGKVSST